MSVSVGFNTVVILGSTRTGRLAPTVGANIIKRLENRGHSITLIDPLKEEYDLPLLQKPYHHYKDPNEAPPKLKNIASIFEKADGFILISSEYNHAPPPALLNMLDHFYFNQYRFKTCGLVTYSAAATAGARSSFVLRNVVSELGMISVPNIAMIPSVFQAFNEDGSIKDSQVNSRIDYFVTEYEWFTQSLKNQRATGTPQMSK